MASGRAPEGSSVQPSSPRSPAGRRTCLGSRPSKSAERAGTGSWRVGGVGKWRGESSEMKVVTWRNYLLLPYGPFLPSTSLHLLPLHLLLRRPYSVAGPLPSSASCCYAWIEDSDWERRQRVCSRVPAIATRTSAEAADRVSTGPAVLSLPPKQVFPRLLALEPEAASSGRRSWPFADSPAPPQHC